jgi:C1A family cysteine protease
MRFFVVLFSFFLSWSAFSEDATWTATRSVTKHGRGYKAAPHRGLKNAPQIPNVTIPDHFDWRTVGAGIPAVKDQGPVGTCWAFAIAGVTESVFQLTGLPHSLSEQYLVSCNKLGYGAENGGDVDALDMYVDPGTVSGSQMPYTAKDSLCKSGLKYGTKVSSWSYVSGSDGIPPAAEIAKAIYLYGPISVAVACDDKFDSYGSGIFNSNTATELNHMVVLVGYDMPGKYWIMRNSWGTDWGENGYMRIKFGADKVGSEAAYIRMPVEPSPGVTPAPTAAPTVAPTPAPISTPCCGCVPRSSK